MKRGDIWWANLPKPAGKRPILLLSRDEAYHVRDLIVVAPVTTRIRSIPTEVSLGKKEGLPKPCVVNLDVMTTIPKKTLVSKAGALNRKKMNEVNEAIKFALGLEL